MRQHPPQATKADRPEGTLAQWMESVVDAIDGTRTERLAEDAFQRDPRAVRTVLPYLKAWCDYFGVEIRGWENVPLSGPFLVVGNHSGGAMANDAAPFLMRWIEERGPDAPVYGLAYDLLFTYPVVGKTLPRVGLLPANPANARKALAEGAAVVVFPGGDYEVFRRWTRRNRIDFGSRKGFLRIALEAGVPVVPMTIHGAHQSTFVFTRGRWLARRLGLERLKIKVFPIVWNIPLGITPAAVPSLQLPSKVTVQIGKPIDWSYHAPEKAHDPEVLQRCYDEITGTMQRTLDELDREHPHPVLTRLNELRPVNVWRRAAESRRQARQLRRLLAPRIESRGRSGEPGAGL